MPKVLITDANARNTIAAVRSLGRKGVQVCCAESKRISLCFFSKYCKSRLVYPSAKHSPDQWIEWLLKEISQNDYDMIMPMDDDTVGLCSIHKSEIEKYCKVPVPNYEVLKLARDKARTIEVATRLEIPCPDTRFITDLNELSNVIEEITFPVVIKPRESSGSRGIAYVTNKQDLDRIYREIHQSFPFPMIQEFIPPGGQACGTFLLFNERSEVRAEFCHKRLREFPLKGGPSTLRESVYRPDLLRMSEKLLTEMNWFGVAMVEYKQDPRDNKFKLMEINPRFWGSLELSIVAGVDFPYLLYRMIMDGDIEPVMNFKEGVRCRWLLPGDLLHFIFNPNRFSLKPAFFDFSKEGRHDDLLSFDDWKPVFGFFMVSLTELFNRQRWKDIFR